MACNSDVGLDRVSTRIKDKLDGLPLTQPEKSIFKIHNQLRKVNEEAYEPQYVAIGPYHRNNDGRLHHMEEQKLHYLQQMLRRRNETSVNRYLQALKKIEVEVRQQYSETVTLAPEEFLEMMLLDGCFIIEYFRKWRMSIFRDENDPLLSVDLIHESIKRDLVLLENQLPFIVIRTLYDLNDDEHFGLGYNLIDLAGYFLIDKDGLSQEINCCKHLLDLLYLAWTPRISEPGTESTGENCCKHLLELLHQAWIIIPRHAESTTEGRNIRTATELEEFGIKVIRLDSHQQFHIEFDKGTLKIPSISIEDNTETRLRNLIAYEQHCPGIKNKYVTNYVSFMDSLVNTAKDVALLRRGRIIENWLGDDETVSNMFNEMGNYISLSYGSHYIRIFNGVNEHCAKRRNRWIALLKRDYFNSPWALISFLAAGLLLLLTLTQTIYTGISFYKKD